ncbi:hypothetical protein CsSME_00006382 [Camellia sinensis var. sinensis]
MLEGRVGGSCLDLPVISCQVGRLITVPRGVLVFGEFFPMLRSGAFLKRENKVAVATRFQRAFVQLLYNAQFEELSARDLILTSALNSDYLLTLPIYVDWKRASESNAIIFSCNKGI